MKMHLGPERRASVAIGGAMAGTGAGWVLAFRSGSPPPGGGLSALVLRIVAAVLPLVFLAAAHALTIATYNVENYLVTDRMVDGVYRGAYPKPENGKSALRRVIMGLAPDVLALQEMGARPYLEELQRDLKSEGMVFPYALVLEAADSDRHVAVLSRLPFKAVRPHPAVPIDFPAGRNVVKRGVLEVTFATEGGDVTLFIIHLKSLLTEWKDDPAGAKQRLLEARAVRDVVLGRFPDPEKASFIVCGDLNDARNSKTVLALLRRGPVRLGELLEAVDARGESWTHHFRREDSYSRIDYVLVSPALRPRVVGGCARVYDGPGVEQASDHRPVYVKLNLRPPG